MTPTSLRLLYAMMGIAIGLLLPFLVPLLDERGLGAAQIGLVLGLSGLVSVVAYPVWGAIADGWLGRRRSIAAATTMAALGGLAIVMAGDDPALLAVAISWTTAGLVPLTPLSDALALNSLGDDARDYGRARAWASVGWAGAAIAAGLLWLLAGSTPVLLAFCAAALGVVAMLLLLIRRYVEPEAPDTVAATVSPGIRAARSRRWWPILASPVLLGFMLGLLLVGIGEHATMRYVGLRILDQGGSVFLVGLAAALPALLEIPVFTRSRAISLRLGLRMVFVWGALIAGLLVLLIALASEAWMVMLLRSVDGIGYALRHVGMVLVIGLLLPRSMQAVGQSLGWLVLAGVAPIVGDVAGGYVYQGFGGTALFITAAALLFAGGAITYFVLAGPRFVRAERPSPESMTPA